MTRRRVLRVDPATLPEPGSYEGLRNVWDDLDRYRQQPRAYGYPENVVRLWAPIDAIHEAMIALIANARISVDASIYGWTDAEIDAQFRSKLDDENVPVTLALDSTQAAGPAAVKLLKKWRNTAIGNAVFIGHSSASDINHLKLITLDGLVTIGGSTNLSLKGEERQNNEWVATWSPVYAAESRARIAKIADEMAMQMAQHRQKLVIDWVARQIKLTPAERKQLEAGIIPG